MNPTNAANPDGLVAFTELAIGDCIADLYNNVVQDATGSMEAASFVEDEVFAQAADLCFFALEFHDYPAPVEG